MRLLLKRPQKNKMNYGACTTLDQGQTYSLAKHITRSGSGWQVVDLNFDDVDHAVKTIPGTGQNVA